MEQKTKIELNKEEVEVFKFCWKNYEVMKRASKIKPGYVGLNLDCDGVAKPEFRFYDSKGLDKAFG